MRITTPRETVVQEAGRTVKEQVKESAKRVKKEAKDAVREAGS